MRREPVRRAVVAEKERVALSVEDEVEEDAGHDVGVVASPADSTVGVPRDLVEVEPRVEEKR